MPNFRNFDLSRHLLNCGCGIPTEGNPKLSDHAAPSSAGSDGHSVGYRQYLSSLTLAKPTRQRSQSGVGALLDRSDTNLKWPQDQVPFGLGQEFVVGDNLSAHESGTPQFSTRRVQRCYRDEQSPNWGLHRFRYSLKTVSRYMAPGVRRRHL